MSKFGHSKIGRGSIKEALDNLPVGICYFDKNGLPVLVNHAMDKIAFSMMRHDLQYEAELQEALRELSEDIFVDENNTIWWIRKTTFSDLTYPISEYIAYDVTELYQTNEDLQLRNQELSEMVESIEETHRNIVAIAREEEILSMKMHIHSEMGKSVLQIHKYMTGGAGEVSGENTIEDKGQEKAALISQMRKSLSMLKGEVGQSDEINALEELRATAQAIGAKIVLEGELPAEKERELLIISAMRECLTNTIRHAGGDTIYVSIAQTVSKSRIQSAAFPFGSEKIRKSYHLEITNNGRVPDGSITEGGGLGSLRRRLERAGGRMTVTAVPRFKLGIDL